MVWALNTRRRPVLSCALCAGLGSDAVWRCKACRMGLGLKDRGQTQSHGSASVHFNVGISNMVSFSQGLLAQQQNSLDSRPEQP